VFAETFSTYTQQQPTRVWPAGRPAILVAQFDATGVTVRINGAVSYRWNVPAGVPMATAVAPTALLGAASWDLHDGWVGRVGEFAVVNRVLTPAELSATEQYLGVKWQVSRGTPAAS
jgi:hypothetical protein